VRRRRTALVARLLAGLVALAGLSLLVAGVLRATVYAPETTTVGRTAGSPDAPVVETAPGALDLDGPSVRVEATAASGDQPVFIGVGRARDVEAYLAQAARAQVTGIQDGRLAVAVRGGEASLPDPAGVDVWAVSAAGRGTAALVWPDAPGQWRVVATTDGTRAPQQVTFTWTRAPKASPAPALIAVGLLLLVVGLVALVLTRPGSALSLRMAGRGAGRGSGVRGGLGPGPGGYRVVGRAGEDDEDEEDDTDGDDGAHRGQGPRDPAALPVPSTRRRDLRQAATSTVPRPPARTGAAPRPPAPPEPAPRPPARTEPGPPAGTGPDGEVRP
jgi:hypothetical protein